MCRTTLLRFLISYVVMGLCALAIIVTALENPGTRVKVGDVSQRNGTSLPIGLVPVVAQTLAQNLSAAWQGRRTAGGVRFTNPAQHLVIEVGTKGFHLTGVSQEAVNLQLIGYAQGNKHFLINPAKFSIHGTRVTRTDGAGLTEWYVNNPLGIEQGFTIEHAFADKGPVEIQLHASRAPTVQSKSIAWGQLRYGKLQVTDANGRVLPATLSAVGRNVILSFNPTGATYPIIVDPLIWVQQKITSSNGEFGQGFCDFVAISGSTAIIGSPYQTVNGNAYQGAAYVYNYSNGSWSQVAELTASNGTVNAAFGCSVALSGSTVLIGAPDSTINGNEEQGSAYVFIEPTGGWTTTSSYTAELTASNGAANEQFGESSALSGSTAIIGAVGYPGDNQGAAYIYVEPTSGWATTSAYTAELTSSDGVSGDNFGYSVATSGSTVFVGAPRHPVGNKGTPGPGATYIFTEPQTGWATTAAYTAELMSSDGASGDDFGYLVAVSGSNAFIGAPFHQVGSNVNQGAAYIYTEPSGGWATTSSQTAELTSSDGAAGDEFGSSVALSGSTALVGAENHTVDSNTFQGAAYLYTEPAGGWTTTSADTVELTASDGAGLDYFGAAVALSGSTAFVGEFQDAAYIFGNSNIDLELSTPSIVAPNDEYSNDIILTNNSSAASPALSVLLPVPVGASYVTSTSTQGSCAQVASTVNCNFGSLQGNGSTASGIITFLATALAGSTLTNDANLALSIPVVSLSASTIVAVPPSISGLTNRTLNIYTSVPAENFTLIGTGSLTLAVSSSNQALLPDSDISISPDCNFGGTICSVSLEPLPGQIGATTVAFTVADTYGQQGNGSFTLTVNDLAPVATNGSVNTPYSQSVSGTLSATTEYGEQMLTYQIVTPPAHGTVTINGASSATFTYTPTVGYSGSDSFAFNVKDQVGTLSNTATESIIVQSAPPPPQSGSSSSSGGGGDLGLLTLGILALLWVQRGQKKRRH